MGTIRSVSDITIPLDRDIFLRTLIREVAGVLEEVIGYEEASGYISLVGQNIGDWLNALYKKEMGVSVLTQSQVAEVLVDLKKRIQGNFSVVSRNDDRIILENTACPFAEKVLDRPSLCMMTSNVFGVIAAENLGYAKVVLEKAIAKKEEQCRVVVYLKASAESEAAAGREYFGTVKTQSC